MKPKIGAKNFKILWKKVFCAQYSVTPDMQTTMSILYCSIWRNYPALTDKGISCFGFKSVGHIAEETCSNERLYALYTAIALFWNWNSYPQGQ